MIIYDQMNFYGFFFFSVALRRRSTNAGASQRPLPVRLLLLQAALRGARPLTLVPWRCTPLLELSDLAPLGGHCHPVEVGAVVALLDLKPGSRLCERGQELIILYTI